METMKYMAYEGGKLVFKTGLKMLCNFCAPGSGAAIEVAHAALCFWGGDMLGGAINTVSGIADFYTFGLVGAIKNGMKVSAKESVIQFAKETAKSGSKEASKKVGQQVGKELAKGVIPSAVEEVWSKGTKMTFEKFLKDSGLSVISSGGHDIWKTILGDWAEKGVEIGFTEALKWKSAEAAFEFTKEAAKKGAGKEFMNQSYRLFFKDFKFAVLKGSIRSSYHREPVFLSESLTGNNGPTFRLGELRRCFEDHTVEQGP